jgi:hypothetical protein
MARTSAIDTEAAGSGLRAANETTADAIGAGMPSSPSGQYVASTSAALTGLLTAALGLLGAKVATEAAATESTVRVFDSAEQANQTSLST